MQRIPSKSTNFSRLGWTVALGVTAFVFATLIHFLNHEHLLADHPEMLRCGVTVRTSDDASYLRPALNFINTGIWKDNSAGVRAYVQRSPGYGMIYAIAVILIGESHALWAILFFQILLWSVAVSFIPRMGERLGLSMRISRYLGFFVALMPMFWGFLSYTLTEAITPSLVIIFYTLLFRAQERDYRSLSLAAMVLGFSILVRPALIVLIFSLFPLIHKFKFKLIPLLLISLTPILLWQLRVERFTGKFDLHPIYQSDANDLYRPLHAEVWGFHKMTGQKGAKFHHSVNLLWSASQDKTKKEDAIGQVINALHPSVLEVFEREELIDAYSSYVDILEEQVPYFLDQRPMPFQPEGEADLIEAFRGYSEEYQSEFFVRSWVVVPLEVFKELTLHSNLSLYIFQGPWRGVIPVEILRWLSISVHFFSFMALFLLPFVKTKNGYLFSLWIPVILYLAYLVFIQRGVEERYTLPFLVPVFLLAVYTLTAMSKQLSTLGLLSNPQKVST